MKSKNLMVGLFVLAGLVLFMTGLFLIGNRHEAFARHMDYYADFTNLAGLSKGSKVQVAGMDAGQVLEIIVPASPTARFRVKLRIEDSLKGLVRRDSVATIGTQGVVGETFLLIHPGSQNASPAAALSLLPSKEPLDISSLLDEGQDLVGDIDSTVKDADGILKKTGVQLGSTLGEANATLANVNDVVVGIRRGKGTAGTLLQDPTVAEQIRQTITGAQRATADLVRLSSQANGVMTDIQSRHYPQKIDETMSVVKSAASNVDVSMQQFRQIIAEASVPDENGATPGMNIREALSNADAATGNVADGTEALKHNFLLRGFFRQRGYFSLSHISTDTYRKDRLFTSPKNTRAWLSSSSMFEKGVNGGEQLTSQGRSLVNAAVMNRADSIFESPVVVEGYANGANAAEQLAISRSRAILVRHYLEAHFMLDAAHIGIVTMGNLPPSGFDHTTWDGVCIVVLPPRT